MRQKDHRALARFFMKVCGDCDCLRTPMRRWLFTVGNVIPDYLPMTYARGFRSSHSLRGHHSAYSAPYIRKRIVRFEKNGVRSGWDCLTLGMLLHYVADAFTYSHTEGFRGNLKHHRAYERQLHTYILGMLEKADTQGFLAEHHSPKTLFEHLCSSYDIQAVEKDRAAFDSRYIFEAYGKLFYALCVLQPD